MNFTQIIELLRSQVKLFDKELEEVRNLVTPYKLKIHDNARLSKI
jgi:hypothetical protein